jgi:hypothetical protein
MMDVTVVKQDIQVEIVPRKHSVREKEIIKRRLQEKK